MRKFLLALAVLVLVLAGAVGLLLSTNTIDSSSLRMILNVMTGAPGPAANADIVQQRYRVPEGFTLSLYAADLPRARFLRFTPSGDLLVSRPRTGGGDRSGDIVLLKRDADGDGRPDGMKTVIGGLKRPLGLDISDGWLYIAESDRISRIRFDTDSGSVAGKLQPLVEGLSDDGNHWSKTIRVGPDKLLYLTQGSTCNVCKETDARRATMMRFQLDGSRPEVLATGLRNSVGFDWAPWNGALYATDNGRDGLGNDLPPCELNHIQADHFYGWPYFYGDNVPDPKLGTDPLAGQRTPTAPAHNFRAHNAPLGMTFVDASKLSPEYERSALVALHGSWNRRPPDGYKVVSLRFTGEGIEERDFLTGLQQEHDIIGRPVDVAQGPDGAIYISDDWAGAIYRVAYGTNESGQAAPVVLPNVNRLDKEPPAWLQGADLADFARRGGELYQRYDCRSCHEDGENPKRLEGLAQRLGYGAVIEVLEAPPAPMPTFPLSETERRELAVFLLGR